MWACSQIHQNTPANRTQPRRAIASCQKLLRQIENTKRAILGEFRDPLQAHEQLLWLALNEAEALAWQTGVPHLVFPTLAREKAEAVAAWHARQQSIAEQVPAWRWPPDWVLR